MSGKNFLIMAGGTGGHIFPALAVAESLRRRGHKVVWLGSEGAMETQIVPKHHIPLETLAIKGVRGNGLKRKLELPFTLMKTVAAAKEVIRRHQINCVIGFGGFVTFPGGVAAKLMNVPLVIHEQNAVAGLANKTLSRWARRVLYAFPKAFDAPDGLVGNPVRADIAALPVPTERFAPRTGRLKVLVVGGSLGAKALNETVPKALALLDATHRPWVAHQSGEKQIDALRQAYDAAGVDAALLPFIEDTAQAFAEADVIVCRAGASTVTEIAAVGAPAVFVPFPFAVDDHQTTNARFLVEAGGGWLVPQPQLTPEWLADFLKNVTRAELLDRAQKAKKMEKLQATGAIVAVCEELVA